jgi:hypothetical protein
MVQWLPGSTILLLGEGIIWTLLDKSIPQAIQGILKQCHKRLVEKGALKSPLGRKYQIM